MEEKRDVNMPQRHRLNQVYDEIRVFGEKHQAQKIVLFGSRARKTNHEKSDIDLAVYGCRNFEQLKEEIQEHTWTLLEFDIIDMEQNGISEELKKEIQRDGVVLYEKI